MHDGEETVSDISIGDTVGDMTVITVPRSDDNVTQGSEAVVEGGVAARTPPMTVQEAQGAVQKEKSKSTLTESVKYKRPYQNLSPDYADRTEIISLYQAENYKKEKQKP